MKIEHLPKQSGIYQIVNTINQKRYIGKSINVRRRANEHSSELQNQKHPNEYLQKAWNKHGRNAFKIEILQLCHTDKLFYYEDYWAKVLKVHNKEYGYNIDPTDPDNKVIIAEETRVKLSLANKGKVRSDKTKRKLSEIAKERYRNNPEQHPMKGKKLSKEHIEKVRNKTKGRKDTKEVRLKKSKSHTGKKRNKEEVKRRVEVFKANRKKERIEQKRPHRIYKEIKIYQCDEFNNTIKIYNTLKDAALAVGCDISAIGYACCGKLKRVKGYKWKREIIEIYEN